MTRVFVTGGSGWIGSAVVPVLLKAGHELVCLARSDAAAGAVQAAGAEALRGSLDDLDALRAGAAASDGVVHLAFKHDEMFSGDFATATDTDQRAVQALGEALAGTDRPLVIASGLAGLTPGVLATEDDMPDASTPPGRRSLSERAAVALADRGVRSCCVRFPPTVHGDGDKGFMASLIDVARQRDSSAYIGDGANHWPAVHRFDAARLIGLALQDAPAGSVLHGIAEEGVPTRAIAEAIGRGLGVPAVSVTADLSEQHFGWLAGLLSLDIQASSARTRALLPWQPAQPGLVEDLDEGHYFNAS